MCAWTIVSQDVEPAHPVDANFVFDVDCNDEWKICFLRKSTVAIGADGNEGVKYTGQTK